jgi:hypothetical protein
MSLEEGKMQSKEREAYYDHATFEKSMSGNFFKLELSTFAFIVNFVTTFFYDFPCNSSSTTYPSMFEKQLIHCYPNHAKTSMPKK